MKQIKLPKKPDSVVNALRDAILSGQIERGAELTQTELAESLGVSRMPIREALIILEYQGLMERLPNQRVRVAEISRPFFEEIFSLAEDAERRIMEKRPPDISAFPDEMEFHRQLYRQTENAFFRKILETVTESYISYGISCPAYDAETGQALLRRFRDGESQALQEYFRRLTESVMEARGQ